MASEQHATSASTTVPASRNSALASESVLCVDLDGTLVRTDTLHESVLRLFKESPAAFAVCVAVLLRAGIAAFKQAVCSRVALRADLLPYNEEIVGRLQQEAAGGRRILLVTAADAAVANSVAERLGFFEAVLASDGSTNVKGAAKVARIRQYLGDVRFEYLGDSAADLPVWKCASRALVAGSTSRSRRLLRRAGVPVAVEFGTGRGRLRAFVRALRVYQWSKNILVFTPLFLAHKLLDAQRLGAAASSFAAFCFAASAIYIVNDLLDLEADRMHPRKRSRPFASGSLTAAQGIALAAVLLSLCLSISLWLPPSARLLMGVYVAASALYSLHFKGYLFLDVITLAGLYTVRLLVGGVAAEIVISPWTAGFSIFFFTSLASCKRLSELRGGGADLDRPLPGRAYFQADLLSLTSLASSSGYAALIVMALYLNSPDFMKLYRRPELMWSLVPLLAYWISRMIMIANRGTMQDDPIVFAFRDRASLVVGVAAVVVVIASLL